MSGSIGKLLLRLFWRRSPWLLLGLALMILSLVAGLSLLAASGWFITASALAGLGLIAAIDIFTPGASIRLAAISRTVSRYLERLATHEATFRLLGDLRHALFSRLIRQDDRRLQGLSRGDTLHRLTRDVDTLDHLFLGVAAPSVAAVALTSLAMIALWWLSPGLALATAGLLLAGGLLVAALFHRLGRAPSRVLAERLPALRQQASEALEALIEVKALNLTTQRAEVLGRQSRRVIDHQRRLARLDAWGQAAIMLLTGAALWLSLLLGLALFEQTAISAAVLGLLVLAVMGLGEAWLGLPAAWRKLAEVQQAGDRLNELIDVPSSLKRPSEPEPFPPKGDIHWQSVGFAYASDRPPVLKDFTFTLPFGERLALVGPSGSGKTTLARLLLREMDPDQGQITLGSTPLDRIDPDALRAHIGLLPQRPVIFRDTLAANLRLAKPAASDAELIEAMAIAGLDGAFIDQLPDGLESWLEEDGGNLSGGQRRRLAMARLLLSDPGIVILDEPTTGLDEATARDIALRLDTWLSGRTCLMISHSPEWLPAHQHRLRLSDQ
ncbi:MAG: thiol reductant ABC exporter subunit CydC [Wenzhouxiangella sp.]